MPNGLDLQFCRLNRIVACLRRTKRVKVKKVVANFLIGVIKHGNPFIKARLQRRIGVDIDQSEGKRARIEQLCNLLLHVFTQMTALTPIQRQGNGFWVSQRRLTSTAVPEKLAPIRVEPTQPPI